MNEEKGAYRASDGEDLGANFC